MAGDSLVEELLNARVAAKLATLERDGSVHLVAIWFLWDGVAVSMPTRGDQRKVRNLERDARATVLVDHDGGAFDVCGVMLVGRAEIVRGSRAYALNRRVHLKYVTERDLGLDPVRQSLGTDDATILLRPELVRSWDFRHIERERLALSGREASRGP